MAVFTAAVFYLSEKGNSSGKDSHEKTRKQATRQTTSASRVKIKRIFKENLTFSTGVY